MSVTSTAPPAASAGRASATRAPRDGAAHVVGAPVSAVVVAAGADGAAVSRSADTGTGGGPDPVAALSGMRTAAAVTARRVGRNTPRIVDEPGERQAPD